MLKVSYPVIVIGRGTVAARVVEALRQAGVNVAAQCAAAELVERLEATEAACVVIVATGSLAELQVAEQTLMALPTPQRPVAVAVVSDQTLPELIPSRVIDDFAVWECSGQELAARLAMAMWRRTGITGEGVVRSGELAVDVRQHRVVVAGREVHLTVREYDLLLALLRARGAVLSRQQLLDEVWGVDYLGGARTVDIHIRRLRAKMPEIAPRIVTVRGVGYRLEPAEE